MRKAREDFLYGVNLGGWLVVEKWMTPSLFSDSKAIDEYTLAKTATGRQRLVTHRQEFITEADIKWLADHGITALRVPVGYWLFDGVFDQDVRETPSVEQLDALMVWAERYGLKVLIDLHGAVGSQNGKDHSGRAGAARWQRAKTIAALERIVRHYRDSPVFWGIELVNEPLLGVLGWRLVRWYRRAYRVIQKSAPPGLYTVFSDAYAPWLVTGALWSRRQFPVAMDMHLYQTFGRLDKRRSFTDQLELAARRRRRVEWLGRWQPIIIGEWSGVLPNPTTPEETSQYIGAQLDSYAGSLGWFYWTYKLESGGAWDFRWLVEQGRIDLTRPAQKS